MKPAFVFLTERFTRVHEVFHLLDLRATENASAFGAAVTPASSILRNSASQCDARVPESVHLRGETPSRIASRRAVQRVA